jgi:hypothetical protein
MTAEEKQTLIQISHKIRRGAEELASCVTEQQDPEGETLRAIGASQILKLIQRNVDLGFSITGT